MKLQIRKHLGVEEWGVVLVILGTPPGSETGRAIFPFATHLRFGELGGGKVLLGTNLVSENWVGKGWIGGEHV